jgi:hypothetical protein
MKNVSVTAVATEVITNEDREQLEAVAAELARAELTEGRRLELLDIASAIAEKYSCDARLCE